MATEAESLDNESQRVIEILEGARRGPRDPDVNLARQLSLMVGEPFDSEILSRLVIDESTD